MIYVVKKRQYMIKIFHKLFNYMAKEFEKAWEEASLGMSYQEDIPDTRWSFSGDDWGTDLWVQQNVGSRSSSRCVPLTEQQYLGFPLIHDLSSLRFLATEAMPGMDSISWRGL